MAFQDIRKSRKWLSAYEIRIIVLFLLILVGLLVLNIYLARTFPAGEWLFQRWSGAQAFLFEKIEPYGTTIAESTQQIVYGRNAFANEYRYVLSDPFYLVLLYTPLALFSDFFITHGIWMLLAEGALVFVVLFSFRLSEWEPSRGLYFILIAYGLLNFFSLNALVTASPSIFLTLLYIGILLALRSFSDELAGALLLLVSYQWEVGGLFVVFIFIFVLANRRWNVLMGFGMSLVVLLIVSFLSYSGWGLPYFRAVLSNLYQGLNLNFNHILSNWFPNPPISFGGAISAFLIALVIIESLGSIQAHFRRVVWTASLALAAMPLVGFAVFPSNYVTLVLPLTLILALVWERWPRYRSLRIAVILIVAFVTPFFLYMETVYTYAPLYTDLLSVLPPVLAIIGLYWMRWWVLHSPRVWADQIGFPR